MTKKVLAVKTVEGFLKPASDFDEKIFKTWKSGQPLKIECTKINPRSLKHHKLYFGGLLKLAFDYWEPSGGLIGCSEIAVLRKFSKWLEIQSGESGAIKEACSEFLKELDRKRSQTIESPNKTIQGLHRWVKEQAGYYTAVLTPNGITKQLKSINFNSMDQFEFNEFYKQAFDIVWKFILSRTFKNKEEVHEIVNKLVEMQ